MTHPSIQGLREAVRASREGHRTVARDRADVADACVCGWEGRDFFFGHLEDLREQAQAAYLTEHGVLLSGEGLVPDPARVPPNPPQTERVGYQADGSYVPCPHCHYVPPEDDCPPFAQGISVMPRKPGTVLHDGKCPTVPQVSDKTREALIEMDRVRRRGAAEAWNHVIG